MARILIVTTILAMCLACIETESPILIEPKPIEPEPVVQYEIPAPIPLALAESYAHVQVVMTEPENHAVLQYIYDLCHALGPPM